MIRLVQGRSDRFAPKAMVPVVEYTRGSLMFDLDTGLIASNN